MEARELNASNDEERWDEFVRQHAACTFYHQIGWKRAVERTYGHKPHYLFVENEKQIVGILPLFLVKDLQGRKALISLPFAPYGGICSTDPAASGELLSQARRLMAGLCARYVEMRECATDGATVNLPANRQHVALVYKVPGRSDEAWRLMDKNRRKKVRKAQNNGLTAEVSGSAQAREDFYHLYVRNMRDFGTPVHSASFFRQLASEFPDGTSVAVVRHGKTVVAATFLLLRPSTLICGWGASLKEALSLEPNDLMYWEVIRYGCEQGFRDVDFGRSLAASGTATFKKEWGGRETCLEYRYVLNGTCGMPNINASNPKYDRLTRLWRHLPLVAANMLGPIVRKRVV